MRGKKHFTLVECLALIGMILVLAPFAEAQNSELNVERSVVAKLYVILSNGTEQSAAAIYVGNSNDSAYFVTAHHALIDQKNPDISVRSLTLQFWGAPDQISAAVYERFNANQDLGIVSAPAARIPRNLPRLTVVDAKADTAIRIIGHPAAGNWSVWAGTLENENATQGDVQHFTTTSDLSLAHGFSGGPVLDSAGNLVGMHTETMTSYAVALKATDILRQLTGWNIPHTNLEPGSTIVPPPNTYAVQVVARHLFIDNRKLGNITSGTITISIDDEFNHTHHVQDQFEDESAEITKGHHQVSFDVDIHAHPKSNLNSVIHIKTTCLTSLDVSGPMTVEPFISFSDRGNVVECRLGPWKKP